MVIAGPAGSGKTTLANAAAKKLDAIHLDFDVVSAGVVASARALHPDFSEEELLVSCKEDRYEALALAIKQSAQHSEELAPLLVIASAPLSRHTQDARLWAAWLERCGSPTSVDLVWLELDPKMRWHRMLSRNSSRDQVLVDSGIRPDPAPLPVIEHRVIDASLPKKERLRLMMAPYVIDLVEGPA